MTYSTSVPNQVLVSPAELPLNEISAFSSEDIELLHKQGIVSNFDLLRFAAIKSQRAVFAEQVGVTVQQVNRWVVLADLSRVPSIGTAYCDFLLQIGICSLAQLARTSMHDLQKQVSRFQIPILKRGNLCPSVDMMATWNRQAKQLTAQKGFIV